MYYGFILFVTAICMCTNLLVDVLLKILFNRLKKIELASRVNKLKQVSKSCFTRKSNNQKYCTRVYDFPKDNYFVLNHNVNMGTYQSKENYLIVTTTLFYY